MMGHLGERDFENLLLSPESIREDRRGRMESHLAACALCREQMDALVRLYASVSEALAEPPSARDRAVAHQVLRPERREELAGELLQLPAHQGRSVDFFFGRGVSRYRGAVSRIVHAIRIHPVRFAGGMSLAAALCIWAVIAIRPSANDPNPVFAKIQDYVLGVYNKDGLLLWKKGVPGMADAVSRRYPIVSSAEWRELAVEDIDGDGLSEVLMTGGKENLGFGRDTLYCYSATGESRWVSGVGELAKFGAEDRIYRTQSVITDFTCLQKGPGETVQLFVLAHDRSLSPSKLYEVNPRDGSITHAYHHRGQCQMLLHHDVDGDGMEELLVSGINDGFNRAALAVLDPSNIDGYAPVPPYLVPQGLKKASEKYYIMLPLTPLAREQRLTLYNTPTEMLLTDRGEILLNVAERLRRDVPLPTDMVLFIYTFGPKMRVTTVSGADPFLKFHDWLLKTGKIRKPAIPACYNELRDSVKYWDGEGFVGWGTFEQFPEGRPTIENVDP